jgi:GAF domain-containing protein
VSDPSAAIGTSCERASPLEELSENAAVAIIHVALEAEATAREGTFATAEICDLTTFFCPPIVEAGNNDSSTIGTINPGNFFGRGDVVSPSQP